MQLAEKSVSCVFVATSNELQYNATADHFHSLVMHQNIIFVSSSSTYIMTVYAVAIRTLIL